MFRIMTTWILNPWMYCENCKYLASFALRLNAKELIQQMYLFFRNHKVKYNQDLEVCRLLIQLHEKN